MRVVLVFVKMGRSSRSFALMWNSMSSCELHSVPLFVMSHNALSSPPCWDRRDQCCRPCQRLFPARLSLSQRAGSNAGNIQFLARRAPSIDKPMCFSFFCAPLAASTSPKVSIACARKAIGERSIGVTSNSQHSWASGSVFESVLPQKQEQQNIDNLADFPCVRSQSFRRDHAAAKGQGTVPKQ